jgi:menaquinone-dependent protoporphyrinogen oxidase
MARILILYSSTDGHTIEICTKLRQVIERHAHDVTVAPIAGYPAPAPLAVDKIVIGASIRYGRHRKEVFEFIDGNRQLLDSKPNAFFSVNIVARKPEKNRPETNPYLRKFLASTSWHPRHLEVFAGKLDYPKYGPLDRMMIRLIMLITKGPTDPVTVVDFTDWKKVEDFGELVSRM